MASIFEVGNAVWWEAVKPLLPRAQPQAAGRACVPTGVAFNATDSC